MCKITKGSVSIQNSCRRLSHHQVLQAGSPRRKAILLNGQWLHKTCLKGFKLFPTIKGINTCLFARVVLAPKLLAFSQATELLGKQQETGLSLCWQNKQGKHIVLHLRKVKEAPNNPTM